MGHGLVSTNSVPNTLFIPLGALVATLSSANVVCRGNKNVHVVKSKQLCFIIVSYTGEFEKTKKIILK